VPCYEVTATGPDHAKHFTAVVQVGDAVIGRGIGPSKKVAEQMAAASAYEALLAAHPEHAAG
jgi:ribonuclease-3